MRIIAVEAYQAPKHQPVHIDKDAFRVVAMLTKAQIWLKNIELTRLKL